MSWRCEFVSIHVINLMEMDESSRSNVHTSNCSHIIYDTSCNNDILLNHSLWKTIARLLLFIEGNQFHAVRNLLSKYWNKSNLTFEQIRRFKGSRANADSLRAEFKDNFGLQSAPLITFQKRHKPIRFLSLHCSHWMHIRLIIANKFKSHKDIMWRCMNSVFLIAALTCPQLYALRSDGFPPWSESDVFRRITKFSKLISATNARSNVFSQVFDSC